MPLQPGDAVPHFEVATAGGGRVHYRDLWQRHPLVAISLPAGTPGAQYAELASERAHDIAAYDARLVITHDAIAGLPQPGALVADQWGEIAFVSTATELPAPAELVEWLRYLRHQCPECQGEAR